jgi:hypothetical protein
MRATDYTEPRPGSSRLAGGSGADERIEHGEQYSERALHVGVTSIRSPGWIADYLCAAVTTPLGFRAYCR